MNLPAVGSTGTQAPLLPSSAAGVADAEVPLDFAQVVEKVLGQVGSQQVRADQAVQDLTEGRTDNVHGVVLEVAKADLAFRLLLEMRNRLAEAYQEIMKMQV